MIQTTVMKGDSEVVHYDCPGVPLYIRTAHLSSYPDGRALCHWHDDLEWIDILEGTMNYYINGQRITLRAGDSLMVTPRQMHYGYSVRQEDDCHFICILLHPNLITQNRSLSQKYLQPLLEDCPADYLHVSSGTTDGNESANILKTAAALHSEQAPGWELKVIGLLICLFADTLPLLTPKHPSASTEEAGDLSAQRKMVSYIYRHYPEKLDTGRHCRSRKCVPQQMLRDLPSVYAADAHRLSQRLPPADQRRSPAPFLRQHHRDRPRLRLSPYELFFRAF